MGNESDDKEITCSHMKEEKGIICDLFDKFTVFIHLDYQDGRLLVRSYIINICPNYLCLI